MVIPANGSRKADYKINISDAAWPLDVEISLVVQMVPVNLIAAIAAAGFDYEMSPRSVAQQVVAGAEAIWQRQLSILPSGEIEADTAVDNHLESCTADAFNQGECKYQSNVCTAL